MPLGLSFGSLLWGLVFSGVGFVAFRYGRSTGSVRRMVLGGALMAYPYFVPGALWTFLVGAALTAALILGRE